jgi:transcriptional regulator with XRE-family HTH domain
MKTPKQDVARSGGSLRMSIGMRLRELRQEKGLSQADLQEKTGVHRCYISRIEHGPTVPSLETLEKFAAALDIPLYRFFYEGKQPPPTALHASSPAAGNWLRTEPAEPDAHFLRDLRELWSRMGAHERGILMGVAKRLANSENPPTRRSGAG